MTSLAARPFAGTYHAQPVPSTFAFGVRHSGVFWFRGSFSDVVATLHGDLDEPVLEGSARVDSISVLQPDALRTHLLGPEFFDAEQHPEIRFRSTAMRLGDDGRVDVDGELQIRGITRPVSAVGEYAAPRSNPTRARAHRSTTSRPPQPSCRSAWSSRWSAGCSGSAVSS